jgi:Na+-transporting methylmalonyl-CoA/oxaloacetate decarboxylase gamma subunit
MLEKIWYELSPVVYMAISCFVMLYTKGLGIVFASLLLTVSLLIGVMRFQFRLTPNVGAKARKSKSSYTKNRV